MGEVDPRAAERAMIKAGASQTLEFDESILLSRENRISWTRLTEV